MHSRRFPLGSTRGKEPSALVGVVRSSRRYLRLRVRSSLVSFINPIHRVPLGLDFLLFWRASAGSPICLRIERENECLKIEYLIPKSDLFFPSLIVSVEPWLSL